MNINLLPDLTEDWEQQPTFEDWDEMESIWMDKFGLVVEWRWSSIRERIIENEEQSIRSSSWIIFTKETVQSRQYSEKNWQILLNGYLNNTIIETLKKVQISAENFYQT